MLTPKLRHISGSLAFSEKFSAKKCTLPRSNHFSPTRPHWAELVIESPCPCVWMCVCAIRCSVFRGLSLALRSHDQFQASHRSSLPPSFGNLETWRLGNSVTQKLGNSETQKLGNSETQKLGNLETRKLRNSETQKLRNSEKFLGFF